MYISTTSGKIAQLHEQTQDGNVIFSIDGGDKITVPAGEFFGDFREATASETEAHAKGKTSVSGKG